MDPESEALVRALHRELNGLTRGRRAPAAAPEPAKPRNVPTKSESRVKAKREDDSRRALDSPTTHERSEARWGKPGITSDSADAGSVSGSESVRITDCQLAKRQKRQGTVVVSAACSSIWAESLPSGFCQSSSFITP